MYDISDNTIITPRGKDIIVYPLYPRITKAYKDPSKLGVHVFSRAHIHSFTVSIWHGDIAEHKPLTFQSVDHYLAYLTATIETHSKKRAKKTAKVIRAINRSPGYYKSLVRKMEPRFVMRDGAISGKHVRLHQRAALLEEAYHAKFNAPECVAMKEYLLSTKDAILVEENPPADTYWGAGHRTQSKAFKDVIRWRGFNAAGTKLMEVRDSIH